MSPISILHIGKFYPPHHGGMETHVHDLAVRQAGRADVNVIVANNHCKHEKCVIEGVSVARVARMGTLASMPICPGMTGEIRKTPTDLAHIHVPNPGAAAAFLLSGHQGRVVITHHADTVGRKILRRLSDPFVRKLMERADCIIVTSRRYLESSTELSDYRDKCRVVPLGIDPGVARCSDTGLIAQLRQRLGERVVLAVGRLVPYKGFDILIRAMKNADAHLVLIGSGPERGSLSALVTAAGVAQKVTMLGRVEDVRPYFAAAAVFVLPSITRAEAFGLVQLEAMAAGLPVVNTDVDSGVPEVSVNGVTGITVAPGDADALSRAMTTLLDGLELRRQMGRAAQERVNSEFTSDLMAARISAIYSNALGREAVSDPAGSIG
jgi:glycosyltransferase involved in cell wall biosynthesis